MQVGSVEINAIEQVKTEFDVESPRVAKTPSEPPESRRDKLDRASSDRKLGEGELRELLDRFNKLAESFDTELRFKVNKQDPHISVQIVNIRTDEIIREIPPQKLSALGSKFLNEVGLIIDELA